MAMIWMLTVYSYSFTGPWDCYFLYLFWVNSVDLVWSSGIPFSIIFTLVLRPFIKFLMFVTIFFSSVLLFGYLFINLYPPCPTWGLNSQPLWSRVTCSTHLRPLGTCPSIWLFEISLIYFFVSGEFVITWWSIFMLISWNSLSGSSSFSFFSI